MPARTSLRSAATLIASALSMLAAGAVARAAEPAPLPPAIDLSRSPHFPAIRDQGATGSCDWFAVVHYQLTFMVNERRERAATPETTFSPQFGYNVLNNGGPFPHNLRVDDVYRFVGAHGAASLAQVPYDGNYLPWVTDGAIWEAALRHRIAGYRTFTLRDAYTRADDSFDTDAEFLHEVKRLLAAREVLVIQSFTPSVTVGTIGDDPSVDRDDALVGQHIIVRGNPGPDHTLALVGYDDDVWVDANGDGKVQPDEKGALKLADSLSPTAPPHNDGFLWMAYRTVTSSIFQNRVNRMVLRKQAYAPRVVARVTLRGAQRDRLHVQVGRARAATPEAARDGAVFDPYGFGFAAGIAGGSLTVGPGCSFDGSREEREGSFAFDVTELTGREKRGVWFLRLRNEGAPITVVRFEIVDLRTGKAVADPGVPVTVEAGEVLRFAEAAIRR